MTQQGDRQASVRAITGTSLTYEGDFIAMFDGAAIAAGDFDGRLLAWINKTLAASYTEINGAMQAYAATFGAANWSSLGSLDPYPGATAALDFMGPAASGLPFYKLNGVVYTALSSIPGWTFTRASSATAPTSATDPTLQTFGPGVPRVVPGLGILIEEARTNSFLNSATGVTQAVTTTAASWTLSFYGTGSITLSGGATGTLAGTGASNRVSLTVTATAAATTLTVTGSVTSVQFEAGAFATSYIPTTSAAVTRAADVASVAGAAPAQGSSYTIYAKFNALFTTATPVVRNIVNLGTSRGVLAVNSSGSVISAGIEDVAFLLNGANTGASQAAVFAVAPSQQLLSVSGAAATTSSNATADGAGTTLYIGQKYSSAAFANLYIQRIALYPTMFSAAQDQAMSAQ